MLFADSNNLDIRDEGQELIISVDGTPVLSVDLTCTDFVQMIWNARKDRNNA